MKKQVAKKTESNIHQKQPENPTALKVGTNEENTKKKSVRNATNQTTNLIGRKRTKAQFDETHKDETKEDKAKIAAT